MQFQTLRGKHPGGGGYFLSADVSMFKRYDIQTCKRSMANPFRMNTCKSVSKQTTLTPFRINTYEKHGGEGAVIVNQTPDEGCPSRATTCPERSRGIGSEGSP